MKRPAADGRGKGDLLFFAAVLLLAGYGVVCVYAASSYNAQVQYGDSFYFMKKQLIGFVLGAAAMLLLSRVPLSALRRLGVTGGNAIALHSCTLGLDEVKAALSAPLEST